MLNFLDLSEAKAAIRRRAELRERRAQKRAKQKQQAAQLRSVGAIELPESGRSSVENTTSALIGQNTFGYEQLGGGLNFEMLAQLKSLWLLNPDFSQFVDNLKNIGNSGHKLVVNAKSASVAESALQRLNEMSARVYDKGAGVDGLLNQYIVQLAVMGAVSSEDVVNFPLRRVEQVAIVPVEQIRFRFEEQTWKPYQQPRNWIGQGVAGFNLIPLNTTTYKYFALETIDDLPYGKPPATAALQTLLGPQAAMIENLDYIVRKIGLLGMVAVNVVPPPRKSGATETEAEYQARAKAYLAQVKGVLENDFNKGLLVTYRDQKIEHTNVASDARGADSIWQLNEEQAFSGMGSMAAFHGRNYTTTETFADVIYYFFTSKAGNVQRVVKRRHEATCKLDLLLAGIQVEGVSLQFNKFASRNQLAEAQADQTRVAVAITKAEKGIISADKAAQELGYESAYDPSLLEAQPAVAQKLRSLSPAGQAGFSATFRFDRSSQRYRVEHEIIELANSVKAGNVIPLAKKKVV